GLAGARRALGQGAERGLVVPDRIVVGIESARPIAGGQEIARAPRLVRAEAPMVAEGFEIAQTLGMRTGDPLERAPRRLVQLGATREEEILIDQDRKSTRLNSSH